MLTTAPPLRHMVGKASPSASDVPTLLGTGAFSLLFRMYFAMIISLLCNIHTLIYVHVEL